MAHPEPPSVGLLQERRRLKRSDPSPDYREPRLWGAENEGHQSSLRGSRKAHFSSIIFGHTAIAALPDAPSAAMNGIDVSPVVSKTSVFETYSTPPSACTSPERPPVSQLISKST